MKKVLTALIAATALSACSHYTEATSANGTTIKHIDIAPSISTAKGCINSGGGTYEPMTTTATE